MYTFFRVSPHHDFLLFHLLFSSLFFSSLLISPLFFSPLFFSSLFSFLSSPFSLLFSLSVFFLCLQSLSLSPCVGGVCLVVCVCVVLCRVVWHAENPVYRLKTLSVCRFKNVPVYAGNTRTCFSTCGRGAGTHGDVLNLHTESVLSLHTAVIASSAYQEQPT